MSYFKQIELESGTKTILCPTINLDWLKFKWWLDVWLELDSRALRNMKWKRGWK